MRTSRRLLAVTAAIAVLVPATAFGASAETPGPVPSTQEETSDPSSSPYETPEESPGPQEEETPVSPVQPQSADDESAAAVMPNTFCDNTDGRQENFILHYHGRLHPYTMDHEWESKKNGGIDKKNSLGGVITQYYDPSCVVDAAGRMHVFVVDSDYQVAVKWQQKPHNSTSYIKDWYTDLGPGTGYRDRDVKSNVAAIEDDSGRMEIFTIQCITAFDCPMWTRHQKSKKDGSWTNWENLNGNFENAAVHANTGPRTGGAYISGGAPDNTKWCDQRTTADGPWTGWFRC